MRVLRPQPVFARKGTPRWHPTESARDVVADHKKKRPSAPTKKYLRGACSLHSTMRGISFPVRANKRRAATENASKAVEASKARSVTPVGQVRVPLACCIPNEPARSLVCGAESSMGPEAVTGGQSRCGGFRCACDAAAPADLRALLLLGPTPDWSHRRPSLRTTSHCKRKTAPCWLRRASSGRIMLSRPPARSLDKSKVSELHD